MDFQYVHIYNGDFSTITKIDINTVTRQVAEFFPKCNIDVRPPFLEYWNAEKNVVAEKIELARILDIKQPYEKQPRCSTAALSAATSSVPSLYEETMAPLYDGFVLQRIFSTLIHDSSSESYADHLHIIFTHILTCTFSEDDWRYHGRAVICGTPLLISTTGIVEAPAKPREFYLAQRGAAYGLSPYASSRPEERLAGRFIDYGDTSMMTSAATGYTLQAMFFFVTDGRPFCENENCRLFNAHWQEDLIRTQVIRPALCNRHLRILNKFNRKLSMS